MSADQPTVEQPALSVNGDAPAASAVSAAPAERPELLVGAAFVGGLALAFLLKRLAR